MALPGPDINRDGPRYPAALPSLEVDMTFPEAHAASMTSSAIFTLGARGSPLSLAQANEARRRLAETHGWEIERILLRVIRTTGDRIQDRPLAEAGGRG